MKKEKDKNLEIPFDSRIGYYLLIRSAEKFTSDLLKFKEFSNDFSVSELMAITSVASEVNFNIKDFEKSLEQKARAEGILDD